MIKIHRDIRGTHSLSQVSPTEKESSDSAVASDVVSGALAGNDMFIGNLESVTNTRKNPDEMNIGERIYVSGGVPESPKGTTFLATGKQTESATEPASEYQLFANTVHVSSESQLPTLPIDADVHYVPTGGSSLRNFPPTREFRLEKKSSAPSFPAPEIPEPPEGFSSKTYVGYGEDIPAAPEGFLYVQTEGFDPFSGNPEYKLQPEQVFVYDESQLPELGSESDFAYQVVGPPIDTEPPQYEYKLVDLGVAGATESIPPFGEKDWAVLRSQFETVSVQDGEAKPANEKYTYIKVREGASGKDEYIALPKRLHLGSDNVPRLPEGLEYEFKFILESKTPNFVFHLVDKRPITEEGPTLNQEPVIDSKPIIETVEGMNSHGFGISDWESLGRRFETATIDAGAPEPEKEGFAFISKDAVFGTSSGRAEFIGIPQELYLNTFQDETPPKLPLGLKYMEDMHAERIFKPGVGSLARYSLHIVPE